MPDRTTGFYWVKVTHYDKRESAWTPAEWDGETWLAAFEIEYWISEFPKDRNGRDKSYVSEVGAKLELPRPSDEPLRDAVPRWNDDPLAMVAVPAEHRAIKSAG
jgi:hypothetical protein